MFFLPAIFPIANTVVATPNGKYAINIPTTIMKMVLYSSRKYLGLFAEESVGWFAWTGLLTVKDRIR